MKNNKKTNDLEYKGILESNPFDLNISAIMDRSSLNLTSGHIKGLKEKFEKVNTLYKKAQKVSAGNRIAALKYKEERDELIKEQTKKTKAIKDKVINLANQKISQVKQKNDKLNNEISKLKNQSASLEQENNKLKNNFDNNKTNYEKEISQLKDQSASLEQENNKLKNNFDKNKTNYEKEISKLKNQSASLEQENNKLSYDNNQNQKKIKDLRNDNSKLYDDLDSLNQKIATQESAAKKNLDTLTKLENMTASFVKLEQENQETKKLLSTSLFDIKELTSKIDLFEEKNKDLDDQCANLTNELYHTQQNYLNAIGKSSDIPSLKLEGIEVSPTKNLYKEDDIIISDNLFQSTDWYLTGHSLQEQNTNPEDVKSELFGDINTNEGDELI